MKKITAIIILILVLGLVGCGNSGSKNIDTNSSKTVEDQAKVKENIDNSIQQLSNLINDKKYDDAKSLIQKLNSNGLDEAQKVNVDKLKVRIDLEVSNTQKDKNNKKQESKKQEYKTKLDNIEIGLKYLDKKDSGTTAGMKADANERYKRWDTSLNEIYDVLKVQLSPSNMKKLQSEEIQWISNRDANAKKASLKFKGGTMEPLEYTTTLVDITKKRCYELVEKYM